MDEITQIKNCMTIWDSRLRRFESTMRNKRKVFNDRELEYKESVSLAEEVEVLGKKQIEDINKSLTKNVSTMKDLMLTMNNEKKIIKNIEEKKDNIYNCQKSLKDAESEFSESKKDVSKALKKIEKYKLLRESLG